MKRFLIEREPIELCVGQIVELLEARDRWSRRVRLDVVGNSGESGIVEANEDFDNPLKIGDLIHYNIDRDHFQKFDPTRIPYKSTIKEI